MSKKKRWIIAVKADDGTGVFEFPLKRERQDMIAWCIENKLEYATSEIDF